MPRFLTLLLTTAALAGPAAARPAALADCDAATHATVLSAAARSETDARAYWIGAGFLRWPQQRVESGRYRLYHSATGQLRAANGQRIAGADGSISLDIPDNLPAATRRFDFTGAGIELAVMREDLAKVPALLTGQVLLVREDERGRVLDATYVQVPGALDELYARAADVHALGVSIDGARTRFQLWAPTARTVATCIHDTGSGKATRVVPLRREAGTGLWSATLPMDLSTKYYTYLVDVFVPGVGVVRNRTTDPYSVGLTTNSKRSYITDLDDPSLKPPGWDEAARPAPLAAQTDMSIYELHVRDFSIGDASVPVAHRGKYLAFTDTQSNGMRHLRALHDAGLSDIHLLPVFDIATIPEAGCITPQVPQAAPDSDAQQAAVMKDAARDCFNWGYDPYHYSVPEGSYASDPGDAAVRIREFRALVAALHAAGLRVGMDVVYNHTTVSGQEERSVLDRIVPGYYHRLDANGKVERSTCCDNTATEHLMMGKLMADSVALWARHYRIDSFRFDLMGHQPRAAMEIVQQRADEAAGRQVNLIGEGWNFGEIADGKRFVQASQLSLQDSGIGTFSDRARDALRGGGCCDSGIEAIAAQGWLNGLFYSPNALSTGKHTRAELLRAADFVRIGLAGTLRDYRLQTADGRTRPLREIDYKGQPAGFAAQPSEVVNYVENHDNQTLFDINAMKLPRDTSPEDRARVQLLGAAFVAFSQGVAYFHAGMDVLRSKSLDRNSFDSGDWFNRLDWTYRGNYFGTGLPPVNDNGKDWELLRPILADAAAIEPAPEHIAWMRDAFRDLLRIRASSTLFRLRTAEDVQQRLRFPNTGPSQNPLVIVGHLDGHGYDGAGFREILYLLNVSPQAQSLELPEEAGKRYVLHPVLAEEGASDVRVKQARFDSRTGRVAVPARTTVVFVVQ
ncbi:alpha-1,6-glucosidase domain-containing protein [Lysobacter sp. Root494]|uniref:alpha-1,6-glucosidase domain-containing protein n=1 Tax=Lysobacter sp. Root494 TaxID=1736549 RepID=UPI0006F2E240|nr:alpha-1,6-glucosidase domain-containing protein [Lysobacter sp. Root494]KQY54829.1 alpha-1,6-glucosidase [Lysobacter sp. Root494]